MEFLSTAAILAASTVLLVEQILKLKIVPIAFANKFPVLTNIILSIIGALIIVPKIALDSIVHIAVQALTIGVVAAIAYNMLIGKSPEIKSLEGAGTK